MSLLSFLDEFLEYFFGDDFDENSSIISASVHSSSSGAGTTLLAVRLTGIGLFALMFLISLGLYIFRRMKAGKKLPTMITTFYFGLPIFIVLRITWIILKIVSGKNIFLSAAGSLCNRLAMCVFLYVFNTLLFYWIDTIHTTINVAFAKQAFGGGADFSFVTSRGRIFFYGVTVLVIILVLILAVVRVSMNLTNTDKEASDYHSKKRTADHIRSANDFIISIMYLLFGFGFLVYGSLLNYRIWKQTKSNLNQIVKSELIAVGFCVCFLLRVAFFALGAWIDETGREDMKINQSVFDSFTYYIPELCSTALVLCSLNLKVFSEDESSRVGNVQDTFIDPLLAEEEEEEAVEAETHPGNQEL